MPDEDVDDGTDWITRTHDLKDGEEANLVLGAGFEREEVELMELPPELLAVIEEGGEMALKGKEVKRISTYRELTNCCQIGKSQTHKFHKTVLHALQTQIN